jgi:hypothetical protein
MQQLARIFLDMEPGDAYLYPAALGRLECHGPAGGQRPVELGDLVTLR